MGENADPDKEESDEQEQDEESEEEEGQAEEDSDDTNYEVCFVVENVEFFTFKQNFLQQSQQFREIVSSIEDGQ